jgi:DNA-binding HxlR family transcriptional regulator
MANSYGQSDCPVARALDAIGEKWSLLILRDLFRKGPLRFQQLEAGLDGVAPNTLSARLKALDAKGVVGTRLYEKHPPRYEYFLTEKGKSLGQCLGRCTIGASNSAKRWSRRNRFIESVTR